MNRTLPLLNTLACLLLTAPAAVALRAEPAPETADSAAGDWFIDDDPQTVPQVGAGELLFLDKPPDGQTPLSQNRIAITESSLMDGWVQLDQCYLGLDAVPEAEVVYRYRGMRGLEIVSTRNIGTAVAGQQSVQLSDVRRDATLCIRAEVRILYARPDGGWVLRNGPFHRKFLDGYFPLHLTLDVQYPGRALRYLAISPAPRPGFAVTGHDGLLSIDSWFAGSLTIEISFSAQRGTAGKR